MRWQQIVLTLKLRNESQFRDFRRFIGTQNKLKYFFKTIQRIFREMEKIELKQKLRAILTSSIGGEK